MKKLIVLLFSFIFASSASATVYKWVDEGGVVSFTDDYSKVPPVYRESVEEVSAPRMDRTAPRQAPPGKIAANAQSTGTAAQAPPIAETLIREGDFAIKLAEMLKIGQAKSEAEAESMLASVGIAPKNGWIADYPMTPIVIGEVRNALVAAAALRKLPMGKDEALQAFEGLTTEFGLAITPGEYAESQPPTSSEYVPPPVISNYYYEQGPPIVTYYPPPWDYYYLYAWVPYPFWCSGFFFPGFFILHDFHHFHHDHRFHHGHHLISNHFIDPKTHASLRVDPTMKTTGTAATRTPEGTGTHGFASPEARKGAASIFNRSLQAARSAALTGTGGRRFEGAVPRTATGRAFSQPGSTGRQYRNFQGPGTGAGRSFGRPHTRSFSSPPSRSFSAPSMGGRSSFGGFHGGGFGSSGSLGGGRGGHWSR